MTAIGYECPARYEKYSCIPRCELGSGANNVGVFSCVVHTRPYKPADPVEWCTVGRTQPHREEVVNFFNFDSITIIMTSTTVTRLLSKAVKPGARR